MSQVHGLILAGGQGSRMGGVDKGWMPLAGRPLVQHVHSRLRPQVHTLTISANRHLAQYSNLQNQVLPDAPQWQGMGPLAALASWHAAYQHTWQADDWAMVTPCDVPLLPPDSVVSLMRAFTSQPNLQIAYAESASGIHPAVFLARVSALASVADYLAQGQRRVRGWITQHTAQAVFFHDDAAFANANTPEALQRLEHIFDYA